MIYFFRPSEDLHSFTPRRFFLTSPITGQPLRQTDTTRRKHKDQITGVKISQNAVHCIQIPRCCREYVVQQPCLFGEFDEIDRRTSQIFNNDWLHCPKNRCISYPGSLSFVTKAAPNDLCPVTSCFSRSGTRSCFPRSFH